MYDIISIDRIHIHIKIYFTLLNGTATVWLWVSISSTRFYLFTLVIKIIKGKMKGLKETIQKRCLVGYFNISRLVDETWIKVKLR